MQKTFVRDVLHDEADLIAVSGEHDTRFAFGIAKAKNVAHDISADAVAPGSNALSDDLLHLVLVARRAWGFDKLF